MIYYIYKEEMKSPLNKNQKEEKIKMKKIVEYFYQENPTTIWAERYGHTDYKISVENDEEDTWYVVSDEFGNDADAYDTLEEAMTAVLNAWENEDEEEPPYEEPDNIYNLGLVGMF